ncbi:MAG TPA: chorismate-binding protein [Burkholderiaceae bacterium]|nr:chorismate-binding protein [Burkholderiaceae bacterium]
MKTPDGSFVLLEDASPGDAPHNRLYLDFAHEHRCTDPSTLDAVCEAAIADLRAGLHAVLLADYEWGVRLHGVASRHAGDAALRILVFRSLHRLDRAQLDAWLVDSPALDCGLFDWQPSVTAQEFDAAIARIHGALQAGECYQVNYTYRMQAFAHGPLTSLYRKLRSRQPVPYGALVALPGTGAEAAPALLSCSPELFLRHECGRVRAQPMKGTAPRPASPEAEREAALTLAGDEKNRAENLMIVDLLRNDIGRIARPGSVKVPSLFEVSPHGNVLQMTSTVEADVPAAATLAEVLRASFPCGSITGAPKHLTMGLIDALESTPRGAYTGALGWLEAPREGRACPDFCLSVLIRTLMLDAPREGLRRARLGVGAGIVLDSVARLEHEECELKARFATGMDAGFELFETMHASRAHGVRHADLHLARLEGSAHALGFRFDRGAVEAAMANALAALDGDAPHRLRLSLRSDGAVSCPAQPLDALPPGPVQLALASHRLSRHALSRHKTSLRAHYDAALREALSRGAFDALFFNEKDHLVEGARSNVFVKLDGRWWTPPVDDGALPGVMRQVLLSGALPGAKERSVTRSDLARAESVLVCNALRGALPVSRVESRGV